MAGLRVNSHAPPAVAAIASAANPATNRPRERGVGSRGVTGAGSGWRFVRRWNVPLNRRAKTIATPGHGREKPRVRCAVAKRVSKLVDGDVQTVIEVDERVRGPDAFRSSSRVTTCPARSRRTRSTRQGCSWTLIRPAVCEVRRRRGRLRSLRTGKSRRLLACPWTAGQSNTS